MILRVGSPLVAEGWDWLRPLFVTINHSLRAHGRVLIIPTLVTALEETEAREGFAAFSVLGTARVAKERGGADGVQK